MRLCLVVFHFFVFRRDWHRPYLEAYMYLPQAPPQMQGMGRRGMVWEIMPTDTPICHMSVAPQLLSYDNQV